LEGVVLIYAGLAKLALVYAYDVWKSRFAGVDLQAFRPGPYLTTGELWAHGFVEFVATLFVLTGIFQFQQGLCRLFGYDVETQCHQPWLSSSPLDFWKRLTAVDRNYMLKYAFYPAYRIFGSPYIPLCVVFFILAASEFLQGNFVVLWPNGGFIFQAAIREAVFMILFSAACCLQIASRKLRFASVERPASDGSPLGNFASAVALWLFLVGFCIQRWVFPPPWSPWPNQIPGRTSVERYLALYGRMAGLIRVPPARGAQPVSFCDP